MSTNTTYFAFVYGTLKQGQPNHYLLNDESKGVAKFLGKGHTSSPFPLVVASEYYIPFLLYKEGRGKIVNGEVYEIDEEMLKTLDYLEDHPKLYERELTTIVMTEDNLTQTQSGQRQCWCYFLKKIKPKLMDLPMYDDYDNKTMGALGMEYVARYARTKVDYSVRLEVQGEE